MKKVVSIILAVILVLSIGTVAFAAPFTPSVVEKPAPQIVPPQNSVEKDTIGHIVTDDGKVLAEVSSNKIIITGFAEVETSKDISEESKANIKEAYAQLSAEDIKLSKIVPELDVIVKKALGKNKSADNLVVRDLFDISHVKGADGKPLIKEGQKLSLTFSLGIGKNAFITAMTLNPVTKQWVPLAKVVNNGDGTVTCEFDGDLGAVAFLVDGAENSAQTGDNSISLYVWVAIAAAAAGLIVVLLIAKNKKVAE